MIRVIMMMLVVTLMCLPVISWAEGEKVYTIVIKDHLFSPAELKIPAGERVKLIVDNQDPSPEEFESAELKREKLIKANKKGNFWLGPLNPGTYHYVGEFHEDTAKGVIVVE